MKSLQNAILPLDEFLACRAQKRQEVLAHKKNRRISIGPDATAYFESQLTLWWQIQEMLRIEKGGEAQIQDELNAYASLLPNGDELVATIMFEIPDAQRRKAVLAILGGVEDTAYIKINDVIIRGVAEQDVDRTNAAGKASSVQFIHFPFSANDKQVFMQPDARIFLGFDHPNYTHMAGIGRDAIMSLSQDFTL